MFLVFVQIAVEVAAAVKSARQTALFKKQNHRYELGDVRYRLPRCRVLRPRSLLHSKVTNSSVNITFNAALDLTSSGILMASSDMEEIPPQACFPTADCYTEVIRLDFQLTGNIWSVLLRSLLERTYGGAG